MKPFWKDFWGDIGWPFVLWVFCIILPFALDFRVGCVVSGIVIFAWYGISLKNENKK